jgi:flavin-dependent dehydrogenase
MYDAIIVGARCAGSPTAMLLSRKGYRVLLVDRSTFPSDTISTHVIWPPGVAQLKRWGFLDKVTASNSPPIRKVMFDVGPFALTGSPPPTEGVVEFYAPRRKVLDKILIDAAIEAGVELRDGFSVEEVVAGGHRVTGIRGRSQAGSDVMETARIVIGADGMRSVVARSVQAPEYNRRPPLACWYYTYWSGVSADGPEIYVRDGRAFGPIPTNDGLVCITTAWTHEEFHKFRADIEGNYLKTLELAPGLSQRVRQGKREERFYGTADLPNFFRKPYGPGWALVGDAGYHKDPVTAQGITDAFRDAELLAEAIDDGFSGRRPLDEALAGYEKQRNETVMPMYEFTCQMAALDPPPPEMAELFAALRGNQTETDRFFGTLTGAVPIPDFYSPENMQRIIGAAQGR